MKRTRSNRSDRKAPGRPTLDDSLMLREALLTVALDEFLENGFAGASIDAIARKAGIGRATIYRQYSSKEQLFRASMEKRTARIERNLEVVIAQPKPPEEILREIIESIHEDFTSPGILASARLVIAEAARFPQLCAAIWDDETRGILEPIVDYLRRLKREGSLDIGDPENAAYHLLNMASGGIRFLLNKPVAGRKARERWASSVLSIVLPGLRTARALAGSRQGEAANA